MDIQTYILDHWMNKMKPESPVLTVYDKEGAYYDILPLAKEKGVKVIDTTKGLLHARLSAMRFWCNELALDKGARMIIYRKRAMPNNNRSWVEEPFACFSKGQPIFPIGAQDQYDNMCRAFLPNKLQELNQLFEQGSTSFNMINALLDGAAYPELEQLTGGKSIAEIAVGLLSATDCSDTKWMNEWAKYAEVQYPGLDAHGVTLKDVQTKFWSYLLFSEFVFDLPEAIPDNLKSVAVAPVEMKDKVYLICDKLRDQISLRETYVRMANRVSESLSLADVFNKAKHLGDRVTFGFENSVEYDRFIAFIKEGKLGEARMLWSKNCQDVWCQEDKEVEVFWNLAEYLLNLSDCINNGINTDGGLNGIVDWYAKVGCKADLAFRKYHTELLGAVSMPKQVKDMTELVNTRYREYTERGVIVYQQNIKELRNIASLRNQGCVQKVYPALKEGKRVVLVMVDALRYEMGMSFAESLKRSYKDRVEYSPRIAYLPSVTRFGMANHLDNIVVVEQAEKLIPLIETNAIVTPEDRIAYLKDKTQIEVQDFKLEDFDATAVNDSTRLLVVRSVGIDTAGENEKLNGLTTMERELIQLARLMEECKRLKFDLAVMVADHGFMLQPAFRAGDQIKKPAGSNVTLEESRLLVGSLNDSADTISFTPGELGACVPAMKMVYARGYTVFKRGEVYYHEGLSLQENVVPIITVKLQEEKKRQSYTVGLAYKDKTDGTVFNYRFLLDINTSFPDLFADDVNIRISVTGDNGVAIGKPDGKFYNDVTELVDIPAGATKIRQPISVDDNYYGNTLTVVAYDAETNEMLSTLKLNFEND